MPTPSLFPLTPAVLGRLERLGQEFLADFYGRQLERHPADVDALVELGNLLTRLGRLDEGLAIDQRLVQLCPDDPDVRYNLACSLALLGRAELALDALERALDLGYADPEHLLADEDLRSLRADARFRRLVEKLSGKPTRPGRDVTPS